jgi:hypothetical protein
MGLVWIEVFQRKRGYRAFGQAIQPPVSRRASPRFERSLPKSIVGGRGYEAPQVRLTIEG